MDFASLHPDRTRFNRTQFKRGWAHGQREILLLSKVQSFRAAHAARSTRVKDEIELILKEYVEWFYWDWPLTRDPEPDKVLPSDTDLSPEDKIRKAAEIKHLRSVSDITGPCLCILMCSLQSIERWLKVRIEPKKPNKKVLKASNSSVDIPHQLDDPDQPEPGVVPKPNADTNKKIDAVHVLLACFVGLDVSRNVRRPTDAQFWSKHVFQEFERTLRTNSMKLGRVANIAWLQ